MRLPAFVVSLVVAAFLGGCSKQPVATTATPGQQATVTLQDGSSFAGTVTNNSTSEITLQAENGESCTYPMGQVSSVRYGANQSVAQNAVSAPVQQQSPVATPALTPAPAPVVQTPPPSKPAQLASSTTPLPPPPREPVREEPPAQRPEPVVETRVVSAGTHLSVRTNETIDSRTASPGQTFSGVVSDSVIDNTGRVAIPRGADATLIVRSVEAQGKLKGQSELALDMSSVRVNGRTYRVETTDIVEQGRSGVGKNKRTAGFLGGGTALGALLGAVAGGGKGAAIGAISGAAAGTTTQALTRGKGVNIPAETILTFRLEEPIRLSMVH